MSLQQQEYPRDRFEVILVDNASSDGGAEWAEAEFPSVKVLRSERNLGYAGGAKLGARHAVGRLLIFLNNDVRLSRDWLSHLVATAEAEKGRAIVGSKIFLEDQPDRLNHAGGAISYLGSGFDIGFGLFDRTPSHAFCAGYVSGAALLIPRKMFDELGGFDDSYFLYCEDVDLCWRAWLRGYRVVVQPAATLLHGFRSSQPSSAYRFRFFHWHKNALLNALKNFEIRTLCQSLVLHLILQLARVVSAIRWSSPWRILLLLRTDTWILRNSRSIVARRISIQRDRKLSDRQLAKMGLFSPLEDVRKYWTLMFRYRET